MLDLVLVTLLGTLFLLFLYLTSTSDQDRRDQVMSYLSQKGFLPESHNEILSYHHQNKISIRADIFSEIIGVSTHYYFRVIAMADVDDKFYFDISKKESGLMFPSDRENFKHYMDYNIETPNVHHTQLVLGQPAIFLLIKSTFNSARLVRVQIHNDKKTWIEIETKRTISAAKEAINLCIGLIEAMRKFSYAEFKFTGEMDYLCFNCDLPISYEGDYCHYCGVVAPKCVICFDDPEPNEEVFAFQCCFSYVHKDHGQTWIEDHKECPYCKEIFPELIKVRETKRIRNL